MSPPVSPRATPNEATTIDVDDSSSQTAEQQLYARRDQSVKPLTLKTGPGSKDQTSEFVKIPSPKKEKINIQKGSDLAKISCSKDDNSTTSSPSTPSPSTRNPKERILMRKQQLLRQESIERSEVNLSNKDMVDPTAIQTKLIEGDLVPDKHNVTKINRHYKSGAATQQIQDKVHAFYPSDNNFELIEETHNVLEKQNATTKTSKQEDRKLHKHMVNKEYN